MKHLDDLDLTFTKLSVDDDGIATLTLNRAEKRNALNAETIDELNREELVKHLQNLAVPVDKKDSQERLKAKLKRALLGGEKQKDNEEDELKASSIDPNLVALMEMMH